MSLTEFTKFIRDCFTGDKHITPEVVDAIYRDALQLEPQIPVAKENAIPATTTAPGADPGASVMGGSTDEGLELSGRQFSDALVRLAAIKYASMPAGRATGRGHARAAPTPPLPLDESFRLLMEQDTLPHALQLQSELTRAEVAESKVREVFQRHKPVLQRIFRRYASMHALREQGSTLSLSAFIVMARDCKLVRNFVTNIR
ncbi:hypothetical protein V7S43_012885 [Phytophthora oleae]|uniref:Uncharacterized protein n=1 Tax=Phytophthora oleae TaxID=2107226 RepID=A0ABD3F9D0_9STRA